MKRSKFTDSQIMDTLKRAEAGLAVPDLCRKLGISSATFYKWLTTLFCMYYGPEYISEKLKSWAEDTGGALQFIQPGKPQQNAYVERFNRTVRYEWLSQYCWADIAEVQQHATNWMWQYNHERPHMPLGGITPKQRLAMAA